jgi:hypothetical protein
MGQKVKLRLNQGETKSVETVKRVREGYYMSITLFNLYREYLINEALAGW